MASDTAAVNVDLSRCAGHGRCVLEAPNVFGYTDDTGQAFVLADADVVTNAEQIDVAIAGCPEQAIYRDPN